MVSIQNWMIRTELHLSGNKTAMVHGGHCNPLHLSECAVWFDGNWETPNYLLISLDKALDCEEAADSCQNALQSKCLMTLALNFL